MKENQTKKLVSVNFVICMLTLLDTRYRFILLKEISYINKVSYMALWTEDIHQVIYVVFLSEFMLLYYTKGIHIDRYYLGCLILINTILIWLLGTPFSTLDKAITVLIWSSSRGFVDDM